MIKAMNLRFAGAIDEGTIRQFQGIKALYLLTTTAVGFFKKLGFDEVKQDSVPESIQTTEEYQNLCPATAVCMVRHIENEAQYYPQEVLRFQEDVPGVKMWGIALDKTMLTYFEVQPHSRFEKHSHESEQITMILDGTLFFEVDQRILAVRKGEVMALPSNIPHVVFTRDEAVKAVDAWSPVMEKYKLLNC